MRRLMLVELNEFDPVYLLKMAQVFKLQHLQSVLELQRSTTTTADRVEQNGLDPWVQWVGVHSGKPTEVHGIRRLGATRAQEFPQIWHAVAAEGCTWGAWGVMNAPLGDPKGCCFFMPDPWSFDEQAFPPYLNDLLALPRYTAKNYLDVDYKEAFASALRLVRFFAPPRHWTLLARFGSQCLRAVGKAGPNVHTFTTLLDYLSTAYFVRLRRQFAPNLSVIFLNHIAHLQHQFWTREDEPHPEMKLGLHLCDAMMSLLLGDREVDEAFILMNALRQKNVASEGIFIYRQRNPQMAIEVMGIERGRVEQCMTHDANILFSETSDADRAVELLDRCYLSDGHKAFFVERQGPLRVFYQFAFNHQVQPSTTIVSVNYCQTFASIFELICERTGAHISEGDVFTDGLDIPNDIQNHEIFDSILGYFRSGARAAPLIAAQ